MSLVASPALVLAEEVPVALVFNGISHAVMMTSPLHLEDFALGFSLTEGLIDKPSQLFGVDVVQQSNGIELQIEVSAQVESQLKRRRRNMAGRTGCGLCGTDSLNQVRLQLPQVRPVDVDIQAMFRAHAHMRALQPLKQQTGATHAAAWSNLDGHITVLREDVGRHNALDKLIGALLKTETDMQHGFICITSRASFEMVQKTVMACAGVLTAVSAPTRLAVELAEQHNVALAGLVRGNSFQSYSHGARFTDNLTNDTQVSL